MTAAPEVVLGLLRTAGLDLALPLAALREVVPCPDQFGELPVTAVGLLGVMSLRSTMVPVLDLAQVLGRPHRRDRTQVVVVLAHQGQVLGLLVDEIRGMAVVPRQEFATLTCSGSRLLAPRTFHDSTHGHVVSMLDPEAVLALPGVPVVQEVPPVASVQAEAGRPTRSRSLTLVRCGAFTLALDVAHVHSTVPSPALHPSPADGPTCLGVTPVAESDVAVVDLLALLGLGSLQGAALDCGLVLDLPAGQVVLGVAAMVGLHDVDEDQVVPLPAMASPSPELLRHVADVPGVGACLLVDGELLLATPTIVSLSRMATPSPEAAGPALAGGPATGGSAAGPPHLAYAAGVALATELSQVVEVLAYPENLVPASGAPGVLGFTVHRGVAVPVLCLASALMKDREPYTAASRLLLVEVDGAPVAYAVTGLHAILPLTWIDATPVRAGSGLRACPLVQLGSSDTLLPLLDLHALTRLLRGVDAIDQADVPALPGQRQPGEVPVRA